MSLADEDVEGGPACGNPYRILGVEGLETSEADINRAYRSLARKYHPDKQKQRNEVEAERMKKKFLDVTEAKNFLLGEEHREQRRKYDERLRSKLMRRSEDLRRENDMSARRKRMFDELRVKESQAATGAANNKQAKVENLRQQGRNMRETHDRRRAEAQVKEARRKAKRAKQDTESRQARIKWSRRKTSRSHSEHSLAELLTQRFGVIVNSVEILGAKGNSALVTFHTLEAVRTVVQGLADSEEMRAFYVGSRAHDHSHKDDDAPRDTGQKTPLETLQERRERQAAERERILKQMEHEERTGETTEKNRYKDNLASSGKNFSQHTNDSQPGLSDDKFDDSWSRTTYPPKIPHTNPLQTPRQYLEKLERMILPRCTQSSVAKVLEATGD